MRRFFNASFVNLAGAAIFCWLAGSVPSSAQSHDGRDIEASYVHRFSQYYVPYAIQAAAAYETVARLDSLRKQRIETGLPVDAEFAVQKAIPGPDNDVLALRRHAQGIFKRWRYEFGSDAILDCIDKSDQACKFELENRGRAFGSGPVFHVWSRTRASIAGCNEVSIAFRGTVGSLLGGSWFTNLNRFGSPYDDYYNQLRRNVSGIMKSIQGLPCYKRANPKPQIVTTGHSLGAGLGQFVALATKSGDLKIAKVFAFDSSPVTGAHLLDKQLREGNAKGLTIDHVYEAGEPLYYARNSPLQEYPPLTSRCDPLVRTVEVKAARGSAMKLHGIELLATNLVDLSYNEGNPMTYRAPATKVDGCDVRYEKGTAVAGIENRRAVASTAGKFARNSDRLTSVGMHQKTVVTNYALAAGDAAPSFTPLPRAE